MGSIPTAPAKLKETKALPICKIAGALTFMRCELSSSGQRLNLKEK